MPHQGAAAPAAALSGKLPGRCALRVSGNGSGRTPHALRTLASSTRRGDGPVAARPLRAVLDSQAHSARPAAHLVPIDLEDERKISTKEAQELANSFQM